MTRERRALAWTFVAYLGALAGLAINAGCVEVDTEPTACEVAREMPLVIPLGATADAVLISPEDWARLEAWRAAAAACAADDGEER